MNLLAALTLAVSAYQSGTAPPATSAQSTFLFETPVARPADVATPDAIVGALYDVISGPAGQPRDWSRFHTLFLPGARMTAMTRDAAGVIVVRNSSPENYVTRSGPVLVQRGFFEREIARRIERYGQVAHIFSTYEARATADLATPPMMRGINSIQLVNDGSRWWVLSIAWSQESGADPIPSEYLPR